MAKAGKQAAGAASGRGMGTKGNVVAIVVLAVVVVALFAAFKLHGARSDARVAVVTDGDGEEYTLPLDEDGTLTVTTSLGTNVVVVEDGGVYVSEADCPNQDCVEMGVADEAGDQIICLPHELVVEVVDDGSGAEYDVVGQ